MKRLNNWQSRFATLVSDRRNAPFVWGSHDCCLWAADAVQSITGRDFAKPFRGTYDSALTALQVLDEHGGVEAIATKALGEPCEIGQLAVGDVVCVLNTGRKSLAVWQGQFVLAVGQFRLESLPMSEVVTAWKV